MRVESDSYTKNHLSATIELFRHYCRKGKVILWRIRIMTGTYKMDVQISYRIHS